MTVGLKRPSVDVVFLPPRPIEDELLAWMAYQTTTMYMAFGLSREQLGFPDQTKPLDRFAAVAQELEDLSKEMK